MFRLCLPQADQSLLVVADEQGSVIKEIRYDHFGRVVEDTNPGLHIPIGFAGGLHDRDTGFVRFGYRDYAPRTARFTAKTLLVARVVIILCAEIL